MKITEGEELPYKRLREEGRSQKGVRGGYITGRQGQHNLAEPVEGRRKKKRSEGRAPACD